MASQVSWCTVRFVLSFVKASLRPSNCGPRTPRSRYCTCLQGEQILVSGLPLGLLSGRDG
jgi:hypothetical protein